jgi:RNA polymerase sigma-70 factor (ECF subfamily)
MGREFRGIAEPVLAGPVYLAGGGVGLLRANGADVSDRDAKLLDALLVLRAQSGDREAMRVLVGRWDARLRTHAAHLLGDRHAGADAAQEAWLSIVRRIGRLRDPERFGPWAMRIVTNKCRDARRRRRARTDAALDARAGEENPSRAGDTDLEGVRGALRALPPDQRALLSLRYAARLPLSGISVAMGLPVGTVKSRLHAARDAVRVFIDRHGGVEGIGTRAPSGKDE